MKPGDRSDRKVAYSGKVQVEGADDDPGDAEVHPAVGERFQRPQRAGILAHRLIDEQKHSGARHQHHDPDAEEDFSLRLEIRLDVRGTCECHQDEEPERREPERKDDDENALFLAGNSHSDILRM